MDGVNTFDPIELAVFKSATRSIAEEMGAVLRRTAFSPNIKERRDYSCAIFDSAGQAIAMGDHMPVHLGSMPMSLRAHHADVGGKYPGSMGLCRTIDEEGIRIPPTKLLSRGATDAAVLKMILSGVRTPEEREGDLAAQVGACRVGEMRLRELVGRYGSEKVQ